MSAEGYSSPPAFAENLWPGRRSFPAGRGNPCAVGHVAAWNITLRFALLSLFVLGLIFWTGHLSAQDLHPIALPKPDTTGGKPLMQVLHERKTGREIRSEKLPAQTLSDLLWASFGFNRPETGGRTAPSAMNAQELDVYVAMSEGLFLYEARKNELRPVVGEDVRGKTAGQPFALQAPVTLIFVADFARMTKANPSQKDFYSAIDTGYVSQNVYLFCASAGLATVVHDLDRPPLAKAMNLRPEQKIILAQAVGFPKQ